MRCRSDADALSAAAADPALLRSEPLKTMVHKISGAAGAFGQVELSQLAAAIDDKLTHGSEVTTADIKALLLALKAAASGSRPS